MKSSQMLAAEMRKTKLPHGFAAFWYIGQEGFVILLDGRYILVDAFLTDMPPHRLYPPVMDAADLGFVDYVFCSHGHDDHADAETLSVLPRVNGKARFIMPAAVVPRATGFGVPPERITAAVQDSPITLDGLTVTPVPAAHESIHMDDEGRCEELGYIFAADGIRIYHAGDCCPYDGQTERVAGVDVAMLPVNGRDYYRFNRNCIGNMDVREALTLAREAGARLFVPMHYDAMRGNTVNPAVIVDTLYRDFPEQQFKLMQPGERFVFMA